MNNWKKLIERILVRRTSSKVFDLFVAADPEIFIPNSLALKVETLFQGS